MTPAELSSPLESARLLDVKATASIVGVSVRTLWRFVSSERFPKPIKLSTRLTRWRAGGVLAWLDAQGNGVSR